MKLLFASLFAALFALASVAGYAAVPTASGMAYNADDSKDDAKAPTTDSDRKNEDDKKKPDEEDKKS